MPEDNKKHKRTWDVVEDGAMEPDHDRAVELSQELIKALDEETKKKIDHLQKPDQKTRKESA